MLKAVSQYFRPLEGGKCTNLQVVTFSAVYGRYLPTYLPLLARSTIVNSHGPFKLALLARRKKNLAAVICISITTCNMDIKVYLPTKWTGVNGRLIYPSQIKGKTCTWDVTRAHGRADFETARNS